MEQIYEFNEVMGYKVIYKNQLFSYIYIYKNGRKNNENYAEISIKQNISRNTPNKIQL